MVGRIGAAVAAAALASAFGSVQALATDVLVLDSDRVLNESAVGEHIRTRIEEIAGEMTEEMQAEAEPLGEAWQDFQGRVGELSPEELTGNEELLQEGATLQNQLRTLSIREQIMARELIATQVQALRPVREALDEVLQAIVDERGGEDIVLIERNQLIFASEDAIITELVIERLNEAISEVDVERVEIPVEEVEEVSPEE